MGWVSNSNVNKNGEDKLIIKEYKENVGNKESTHAIIMRVGEDIVYELVIKDGDNITSLATLRTWTQDKIPLTDEELKEL